MSTEKPKTIIDFEHLKKYIGDDIAIIAEVFGLFKHQVDMWGKMLHVDADDETWRSVMHSLKGSAKAVGAIDLANLCEQGEVLVAERSSAVIREPLLHDVQFSIDQVKIEIGRWEYRQKLASMRT